MQYFQDNALLYSKYVKHTPDYYPEWSVPEGNLFYYSEQAKTSKKKVRQTFQYLELW